MWAGSLFAQQRISEQIGNVVTTSETGQGIAITCNNARVLIQPYTDQMVRVRVVKNDFGPDFSYAVNITPAATFSRVADNDETATYSTTKIRVVVHKKPFYLSFYNQKGELVNADDSLLRISWMGTEVTNYKKLFADEKFIGLGEKTGGLNRRGNAYQNWNSDAPGYGLYQDPLYATIPFT